MSREVRRRPLSATFRHIVTESGPVRQTYVLTAEGGLGLLRLANSRLWMRLGLVLGDIVARDGRADLPEHQFGNRSQQATVATIEVWHRESSASRLRHGSDMTGSKT